jgi:hypothetical protein
LAPIADGIYGVVLTATDPSGNVSSDDTADELTITPDTDGDGVNNAEEDAGPNSGDGNADGIADADQASVASLLSSTGEGYVTLVATGCGQLQQVSAIDPATLPADPAGSPYPFGLVEFSLPCESAGVDMIFEEGNALLFSTSTFRKFGPATPGDTASTAWYDFTSAASVSGNTWSLILADNLPGDDTADDGVIIGRGGPAIGPSLPVPFFQPWALWLLIISQLAIARRFFRASEKRSAMSSA